jgi:hypothetical protein
VIQFTSGCAVHWHSRAVLTAIAPAPPVAGTVEGGASKATEHFDTEEGEVIVFPDEPHPASPSAAARTAAIAAETRREGSVKVVHIFETAVVAAGEEHLLSRCLPTSTVGVAFLESPARCRAFSHRNGLDQ